MSKCHYCDNVATKNIIWLKDKRQRPTRITLAWCGCDLMTALQRFWISPYPVKEGVDYEVAEYDASQFKTKALDPKWTPGPPTDQGSYWTINDRQQVMYGEVIPMIEVREVYDKAPVEAQRELRLMQVGDPTKRAITNIVGHMKIEVPRP